MRLLTAEIRNYRVHRRLRVSFDEQLTVITGPNESGKSTLADALHRGLFLSSRATGQVLDAIHSDHGGVPEVELTFERAGSHIHLLKHFNGSKGTTTLSIDGGAPLKGAEADEKLAELLGLEALVRGGGAEGKLRATWAHLWVWQGTSATDPLGLSSGFEDQLQLALQKKSDVADLVESPLEQRLWRRLTEEYEAIFDQRGNAKKSSPLARAAEALEGARRILEVAKAKHLEHVERAETLEAQTRNLEAILMGIEQITAERAEVEARAKEIEQIERELGPPRAKLLELEAELGTLEAARVDLEETLRSARELEGEAASAKRLVAETKEAERLARAALREHEGAFERAQEAEKLARGREALAAAWIEHDKASQLVERLEIEKRHVDEWRQQIERIRAEIELIELSPALLEELEALSLAWIRERARAEALAARVELVTNEGGLEISLDGAALVPGEAKVLSDVAELVIGQHATLRVSPGAAEDLTSAREKLRSAREDLERACERYRVADVDEARRLVEQKNLKANELSRAERAPESKRAGEIDAQLVRARADAARCATRLSELSKDGAPAHADLEAWEEERGRAAALCAEAGLATDEARTLRAEAARALGEASEAHERASSRLETITVAGEKLQARQLAQASQHGGGLEQVATRSAAAVAEIEALRASLAEREARLASLDPTTTRETLDRNDQALERDTRKAEELRKAIHQARVQLEVRAEGAVDPRTELDEAQAQFDRCERVHERERLEAEARKHLAALITHERKTLGERVAQPLLEAVDRYLRVLFGPDAHLDLRWLERGFDSLDNAELKRRSAGLGAHAFSNLSGGAREQVAVAVRLALAEVLADEHGGVLPLILDDAFTNSDPERVKQLRSMLSRAARSGKLQLVILSCQPSDYAGLAGAAIELPFVRQDRAPSSEARPELKEEAWSLPAVNTGDADAFMSALEELGGGAGNQRLRERLEWDEARYDAVKSQLVGEGRLVPGRGRGGSVKRVE